MIEKFEIIGLFGDRNISIDFQKDENVKILVGENGTGKTHILNILYYILSGRIDRLSNIEFEKIILKVKDYDEIQINKNNIDNLGINYMALDIYRNDTLIYLPTYRRVEEDLEKLGLGNLIDEFEKNNIDKFIQFGMDDTQKYIKNLLDKIKSSSLIGFNEMSGDIINNLIDSSIDNYYDENIENIDILYIVLSRSNISNKNIKIIINKVQNREIYQSKNQPLFLYLTRLIKVYEKQKEKDELIKKFKNTCNKYLVDKNFFGYPTHKYPISLYLFDIDNVLFTFFGFRILTHPIPIFKLLAISHIFWIAQTTLYSPIFFWEVCPNIALDDFL